MRQKSKFQMPDSLASVLVTVSVAAVCYAAVLLIFAALFVVCWDWTAVPLFAEPTAPFTAGLGVGILLTVAVGLVLGVKEVE